MKSLIAILFASFFASTANAYTVNCRATANVPGTTLNGNCRNGFCSLNGYSSYVSATGTCDDGQRINLTANVPGAYVSTQCRNGWLSARINGTYLNWSGSCSTGGYLSVDSSYLPGGFVSGSCSENGFTSVRSNPEYVSITATCTVPN